MPNGFNRVLRQKPNCHFSGVPLHSHPMEIYDHPTFHMACRQFDLVADRLEIPPEERDRLKYPKRSMAVALPIHCEDGSTKVYTGYRVQHHLTLGPTKGG